MHTPRRRPSIVSRLRGANYSDPSRYGPGVTATQMGGYTMLTGGEYGSGLPPGFFEAMMPGGGEPHPERGRYVPPAPVAEPGIAPAGAGMYAEDRSLVTQAPVSTGPPGSVVQPRGFWSGDGGITPAGGSPVTVPGMGTGTVVSGDQRAQLDALGPAPYSRPGELAEWTRRRMDILAPNHSNVPIPNWMALGVNGSLPGSGEGTTSYLRRIPSEGEVESLVSAIRNEISKTGRSADAAAWMRLLGADGRITDGRGRVRTMTSAEKARWEQIRQRIAAVVAGVTRS